MRARDVMTRAVATTTLETTVEKVVKLLINLRISGIPVLDRNGQLVGIVTEGDLLRRVETGTAPALALERVVFCKFPARRGIHQVARPAGRGHHDPGGRQRRGVGQPRRDR